MQVIVDLKKGIHHPYFMWYREIIFAHLKNVENSSNRFRFFFFLQGRRRGGASPLHWWLWFGLQKLLPLATCGFTDMRCISSSQKDNWTLFIDLLIFFISSFIYFSFNKSLFFICLKISFKKLPQVQGFVFFFSVTKCTVFIT